MVMFEKAQRSLALGALAAVLTFNMAVAQGPAASAARPAAQIDRNGVLILIRSTLTALQQANETGNYTVLRDLGSEVFQQTNNAARLGEIFANLRAQKLDLSGVVVLEPQLTLLPQIESTGAMHMAGFFPSVPVQINFELAYAPTGGRWRLSGISVGLGSSAPVAPSPAPRVPPPEPVAQKSAAPKKKPLTKQEESAKPAGDPQ